MVIYGGGWMYLIYVEWTPAVDFNLWIYFGGPLLQTKTPPQEALACKCVPAVVGGINAGVFSAPSVVVNLGFGASGEVLNLSAFPAPTCIRKKPRAISRASKNTSSLTFYFCRPLVTVMNPFPRVLMNFL